MKNNILLPCVSVVALALAAPVAGSATKPDFADPDGTLASIKTMLDACTSAGAKDCIVRCGYAQNTLTNFLKANPQGDPGILKQRWQPCFDAHRNADLAAAPAPAAGTPDFSDHQAVVASVNTLLAECGDDATCQKQCGYVTKSLKNFNHPQPHYAALRKSKWESCRDKVPGKAVETAEPTIDRSRFVVADLALHRGRLFHLEAWGYSKETKREHNHLLDDPASDQGAPDIVKNYRASIKEPGIAISLEALGDGRIYQIQFEQKESLDPDQVTEALVERYGKPTQHQGNYLSWGCDRGPQQGFCVKANPSTHGLTIWAFDEDVKNAGYRAYEQEVMTAKGIKSGPKF